MHKSNAAKRSISKILSANDTGETGGHQAGILVPKQEEILSFFPPLERRESIRDGTSFFTMTRMAAGKWRSFITTIGSLVVRATSSDLPA